MSAKDKLIVKLVMQNEVLKQSLERRTNESIQWETRAYTLEEMVEKQREELDRLRGEAFTLDPDDLVAQLAKSSLTFEPEEVK